MSRTSLAAALSRDTRNIARGRKNPRPQESVKRVCEEKVNVVVDFFGVVVLGFYGSFLQESMFSGNAVALGRKADTKALNNDEAAAQIE